ncbi:hypothetical protein QBK99_08190 [Corticibacterium sp. UT-5YL-CI-8]|nr:hypothetical protein [Tianweitania sp. UT-5YL-CI-8]
MAVSKIDTASKRAKVGIDRNPVWERVGRGIFLGFRKQPKAERWCIRYAVEGDKYTVETFADVHDVSYDDAKEAALVKWRAIQKAREDGLRFVPTIGEAVEAYLTKRENGQVQRAGSKARSDGRVRLARYVLGDKNLCGIRLDKITQGRLATWIASLDEKSELGRLSHSSKSRLMSDFRAALNHGWEGYRKLLPVDFQTEVALGLKVQKAKKGEKHSRDIQFMSTDQVSAVMAAAKAIDAEVYRLFIGLKTGMRFAQVMRCTAADLEKQGNRYVLMIPVSLKGSGEKSATKIKRFISQEEYKALLTNREMLFDTERFRLASYIARRWHQCAARAELPSGYVPYAFRHTSIVSMLKEGLPVQLVAALHDTSEPMIRKHYALYITDALSDMVHEKTVEKQKLIASLKTLFPGWGDGLEGVVGGYTIVGELPDKIIVKQTVAEFRADDTDKIRSLVGQH